MEEQASAVTEFAFEVALLSDVGTARDNNEDACGHALESSVSGLFVVADGVGGHEGGELASQMAVEVTIKTYLESPTSWGAAKRLYRAVQQANIEIHDRAVVVTELRRMSTTITAAAIDRGVLYAGHVGDSRLYLLRGGTVTQVTKDHTVAADRARLGLISKARVKTHPERSTLTRSLGRELIVAVDRITVPLAQEDVVIVCSDGLHNVLEEPDLEDLTRGRTPEAACSALVKAANDRGTGDNVTAAVCRMVGPTPPLEPRGWSGRFKKLLGRA